MSPLDWGIAAAAIGIIVLTNWYFLGPKKRAIASANGGVVDLTVRVEGGYSPAEIEVPAGSRVRMTFDRRENNPCSDELVIADLTGLNANVMYELAVRHCARLPIVVVAEEGTTLPFDVATDRVIFYVNDMKGVHDLAPKLEGAIKIAIDDATPDNPVYRAAQDRVMKAVTPSDSVQNYILERLDKLDSRMGRLLHGTRPQKSPRIDNSAIDVWVASEEDELIFMKGVIERGLAHSWSSEQGTDGPILLRLRGVPADRRAELAELINDTPGLVAPPDSSSP